MQRPDIAKILRWFGVENGRIGHLNWSRVAFILIVIAAVATLDGLVRFSGGWAEVGPVFLFMALALTVALHGILFLSARSWFSQRSRVFLAAYGSCALLSVTLASGFWYHALSLDQKNARDRYHLVVETALDQLGSFDGTYDALVGASLHLADYSKQKSVVESSLGGTCDTQVRGVGNRAKYRVNDSQVLADYGQHFLERREALKALVREARSLLGVKVDGNQIARLREIASKASQMAGDARILQFKKWLTNRVAEGREGVIQGGEFFRCRDAVIEERARAISGLTLTVLQVPELPNPEIAGNNIIEAFSISFKILTFQWSDVSSAQLVAIVVGLIIDAAILLLIWGQHRDTNPLADLDLDGIAAAAPSSALGLLLSHAVRRGSSYHVYAAPGNGQTSGIISALEHAGAGHYKGIRPRWRIPYRVRAVLGANQHYAELYEVPVRPIHAWAVSRHSVDPAHTEGLCLHTVARTDLPTDTAARVIRGHADMRSTQVGATFRTCDPCRVKADQTGVAGRDGMANNGGNCLLEKAIR